MSQDYRVDELLKDLDTALSVEPLPVLAATVRTRIAAEPGRGWFGSNWRWVSAMASAVVIGLGGYSVWPRSTPIAREPEPSVTAVMAGKTPATAMVPPVQASQPVRVARAAQTKSAPIASAAQEPEVIVSASVRAGLDQLNTNLKSGRITAETLLPEFTATPEVITLTPIAIEIVEVEWPSGVRAGGGVVR
jgi:hypothetical protein